MSIEREKLPKSAIPIFMVWVAACNVAAIIMAVVFKQGSSENLGYNPTVSFWLILVINVLSIILLYPLFGMDPVKKFMKSAIIWFVLISVVYLVIGAFLFLIPGVVQLLADVWFNAKIE